MTDRKSWVIGNIGSLVKSKLINIARLVDLHDRQAKKWVIWVCRKYVIQAGKNK